MKCEPHFKNHFIVKCYAGKASFLLVIFLPFFFVFCWHNTFVQTSFKNINKLEPLRLSCQKTHYQMSWRRTNIFRKRFTNEMSLQNIKERKKKRSRHTKYYQKTSKFVWYQPFSALNNSNFFSPFFSFSFFFVLFFCFLLLLFVDFFFSKNTLWRREKRKQKKKWTAMVRHRKTKKEKEKKQKHRE